MTVFLLVSEEPDAILQTIQSRTQRFNIHGIKEPEISKVLQTKYITLGASIELSADAPLREPYAAWMQGGLNFHSGKLGVMLAAQAMLENGTLKF